MNYTLCYKIIWLVINLVLIFTSEDCLIVTALELLCREHYQTSKTIKNLKKLCFKFMPNKVRFIHCNYFVGGRVRVRSGIGSKERYGWMY